MADIGSLHEGRHTQLAAEIQDVGRELLETPGLHQLEPGLFSSCQATVTNLPTRIVRAVETGVPLVEISTLDPDDERNALMRKLFGKRNPLIHGVLLADGRDEYDRQWGARTNAGEAKVMRLGVEKVGYDDGQIDAYHVNIQCYDYDKERPSRLTRQGYRRPGIQTMGTYRYESPFLHFHETAHQPVRTLLTDARTVIGLAVRNDATPAKSRFLTE